MSHIFFIACRSRGRRLPPPGSSEAISNLHVGASNIGIGGIMRHQDKGRLTFSVVLLLFSICLMGPRTACAKSSPPVYVPPPQQKPPTSGYPKESYGKELDPLVKQALDS